MRKILFLAGLLYAFISLVFLVLSHGSFTVGTLNSAHAQQDWQQEYADVCAKTQNAMLLSTDELEEYIERCDKLQDRINELDGDKGGTARKVYGKRLKMCRDLYKYVLDYNKK
jgi:hypothetical protein